MRRYEKKNLTLPVSLHDAVVTSVDPVTDPSDGSGGRLTLVFADGYFIVSENDVRRSGRATVMLSGIDYDFSHVYICGKTSRREISFGNLVEDTAKYPLEIIDELYGYNQSRFSGTMYAKGRWYTVEIEVYHFRETIYEWEEQN